MNCPPTATVPVAGMFGEQRVVGGGVYACMEVMR
jgi:hypothetical protein